MLGVIECLFRVNGIAKYNSMCTSIEYFSNRSEILLSSSVPDLQFDYFVFYLKYKLIELNADSYLSLNELVFEQSFDS